MLQVEVPLLVGAELILPVDLLVPGLLVDPWVKEEMAPLMDLVVEEVQLCYRSADTDHRE
jgi:hypothetical protein